MPTPRYLTVAELQAYVRSEVTYEAAIYDEAITTAEGIIDNACGRRFIVATTASARVYMPSCSAVLFIDDCTAITSVVANGATLVSGTDYQAEPLNSLSYGGETTPFFALRRLGYYPGSWDSYYGIQGSANITITATWGWLAIPAEVKESCKIIARDVLQQRETTGFGLVAITESGGVGTRENWIVQKMVRDYTHPRAIATP